MRRPGYPIVTVGLGIGLAACSAAEGRSEPPMPPGDCDRVVSGYPGDCLMPDAVDPEVSLVAHHGPSDYDDPDEVDSYVILPGEEPQDCVYTRLPGGADTHYDRYDVHSRPGTHHVLLTGAGDDGAPLPEVCVLGPRLLAVVQGSIEGGVYRYPPSGRVAPENEGLGTPLSAGQLIAYELHAVNPTDGPLLKESWTVFHTMPEGAVREVPGQLAFNGGMQMNIAPHTRATVTNSCEVTEALGTLRVLDLFGHMHAHGERVSAWAVQRDEAGAELRTLVYESYDWSELDLIEFNSVTENPTAAYRSGAPGGTSGPLVLGPGDRLDYECEVNNTEDFALRFKARAFDGEMCNLFGSFTPGTGWFCVGN